MNEGAPEVIFRNIVRQHKKFEILTYFEGRRRWFWGYFCDFWAPRDSDFLEAYDVQNDVLKTPGCVSDYYG